MSQVYNTSGIKKQTGGVLSDHGAAIGLTDDDHTQYVLNDGTRATTILAAASGDYVRIGGGATASELRFLEPSGGGTDYLAFKAPALAASVTWTLPNADATVSGYALVSNAAGVLSWAAAGVADHGGLTGLGDDDHTIYALLAGRAGGQTLYGGTGASDPLTLRSTSNGTKGVVALADDGGNVTVGGAATASELRFLEPSGSGTNYMAFKAQAMAANVTYTLPAADATTADGILSSDAAGALSWKQPPYDLKGFFAGAPTASELITRFVADRTFVMPINLTGSQGYLGTAATASTTFDIQVNGVSKGSMVFAAAGQVATFTFAASVTVVAGDLVAIVAPGSADATAANLSFAFKCYRTN